MLLSDLGVISTLALPMMASDERPQVARPLIHYLLEAAAFRAEGRSEPRWSWNPIAPARGQGENDVMSGGQDQLTHVAYISRDPIGESKVRG
jgi:hypothetical protein